MYRQVDEHGCYWNVTWDGANERDILIKKFGWVAPKIGRTIGMIRIQRPKNEDWLSMYLCEGEDEGMSFRVATREVSPGIMMVGVAE